MTDTNPEQPFQPMETAPRDGTIVEIRSALRGNPAIFKAGYVRPLGLVVKCWVPVRGQKCGGMPWKDSEVDGWRPVGAQAAGAVPA